MIYIENERLIKNQYTNYIVIFLKYFAFIESIWLINQPVPRQGLEYIWLIPIVFLFSIHCWGKIFYFRKGVGLNIYLIISFIRYLLQPLLITLSNGELNNRMPNAEATSYEIAIAIYILECIIAFKTIHHYYNIEIKKFQLIEKKSSLNKFNINPFAWGIIFIYIAILILRLNVWFPGLNIIGLKQ